MSVDLLDQNPDAPAAGKPHPPGSFVGNAKGKHPRLAVGDHLAGLGHHRSLDTAARHRALEIAFGIDHQMAAHRARRRPPGLDHGRKRQLSPVALPALGNRQDIMI